MFRKLARFIVAILLVVANIGPVMAGEPSGVTSNKDVLFHNFDQRASTVSSFPSLLPPTDKFPVDALTGVAAGFIVFGSNRDKKTDDLSGLKMVQVVQVNVKNLGDGRVDVQGPPPESLFFDGAIVRFPISLFPTINSDATLARSSGLLERRYTVPTHIDSTNGYVYIATSEFGVFSVCPKPSEGQEWVNSDPEGTVGPATAALAVIAVLAYWDSSDDNKSDMESDIHKVYNRLAGRREGH